MTKAVRRRLLGAGVVLGLFLLFRVLLLWRFPPFFDEAIYAGWAQTGLENPADRFISLTIGYEPLFPWAGSVAMWLGAAPFTAVRLVSTISGLVTLVMCGLIGRELGGWRSGLAAAGLAAIVPFFVVHDVIGIIDPLATALSATAVYLTIRLARRPALAEGLLLGIVSGACLLTKRTTYPALALIPAGLLVFNWSPAGRWRRLGAWIGNVAIVLLVAYALYSIMKLSIYYDDYLRFRKRGGAEGGPPFHSISEGLRAPRHWLGKNWAPYSSVLAGYVTVPIIAAAAIGVVAGLRRRANLTGILFLWFLIPFVSVLLLVDIPYPRYLLVATPPLLVLAGYGLVAVLEQLQRVPGPRGRAAALAAAAIVLLGPALLFDARVLASPETATYPGLDDAQYVTGAAALAPYKRIAQDLRRYADGRSMTVALGDFTSGYLPLEFHGDPTIVLVGADDPGKACPALYAVASDVPLQPRPGGMVWHELARYPRPRHGASNVLYEGGVRYNGHIAVTPDELRALIGPDSDYDAFGAAHPCAGAWAAAWYELHPPS